jgi:hypothetical protein
VDVESITSKLEIIKILNDFPFEKDVYQQVKYINKHLLLKKVKFPLLEIAAKQLSIILPVESQIEFLKEMISLKTIGGNVIAGIILQSRLPKHFNESFEYAVDYICFGDEWYVCDIIGERVFGYALLTQPEKTIPVLNKFKKHNNEWIIRSIGVATHYAVKKGLKKKYVEQMFNILLSMSHTTKFHIKKGVGWAVKTIAKFHPEIVDKYSENIKNDETIKQWFKTKIKIGLGRSYKYASKYTD